MVTFKQMKNCRGKHINLFFTDGEIWGNVFCTNFYQQEDDEEEHCLEFENTLINQSQIEKIEILD